MIYFCSPSLWGKVQASTLYLYFQVPKMFQIKDCTLRRVKLFIVFGMLVKSVKELMINLSWNFKSCGTMLPNGFIKILGKEYVKGEESLQGIDDICSVMNEWNDLWSLKTFVKHKNMSTFVPLSMQCILKHCCPFYSAGTWIVIFLVHLILFSCNNIYC